MPFRRIDPSRPPSENQPPPPPAHRQSTVHPTVVPGPRKRTVAPTGDASPTDSPALYPSHQQAVGSSPESAARKRADPKRSGPNWDDEGNYKIGKGKPPVKHQFGPGVSGNPKGPKKGSRTYTSQAKEILGYAVPVKFDGNTKKYDSAGVGLIRLREASSRGDLNAIEKMLKRHREVFPDEEADAQSELTEAEQASVDALLAAAGYQPHPVVREKRQIRPSSDTAKDDEL